MVVDATPVPETRWILPIVVAYLDHRVSSAVLVFEVDESTKARTCMYRIREPKSQTAVTECTKPKERGMAQGKKSFSAIAIC